MHHENPNLVSTTWLADNLGRPDIAIVDASWYLPAMKRDGKAEYLAQHIPGAVYFDIDELSEPGAELPHTLASPDHFAKKAGELGISEQHTIIVYDGIGLFSAARAWWNFRVMGAKQALLLDGGMAKWLTEGLPVEAGAASPKATGFRATPTQEAVVGFDEMQTVVSQGRIKIADARPFGRFTGEQPEPREGMRSGHMPGALSVPAMELSRNGQLLPLSELKAVFANKGISENDSVITTCGSGVTAATISLALTSIGHANHRLYDGSWSQWGSRNDTDIVTGS